MTAELGQLFLVLALLTSLVGSILPLAGTFLSLRSWQRLAVPAAHWNAIFGLGAIFCLGWGFYFSDFSILNVVRHSNSALPWYYKIAAVWGSHEGSILFWVAVLGVWSSAVALSLRRLPLIVGARVLGILSLVSVGLYLFILFTSNPFLRWFPPALDGADLNPLLQDPGMIFHPPLLYLGYVGFAVPFAFAMAALLSGRFDLAWARWMRPWTAVSWVFLTLGISLGSYWSYYELGWGGWWAWDPVENSSLMPWLTGTALMHSLIATQKRGVFKLSTVFLAILTFALSLLGTFLVRSGVLTSVHAFTSDPERGLFILIFLLVSVGLSFFLFALKGARLAYSPDFKPFSKETLLMTGNVLLVVSMGTVLLGTLYPLAIDALNLGKISVGSPYFNTVFGLMALIMGVVMTPALEARWVAGRLDEARSHMLVPALIAFLLGMLLPWVMGEMTWTAAAGFALSAWIAVGTGSAVIRYGLALRRQGLSLKTMNLGFIAMAIAHIGVAMTVFGATAVSHYEVERQVRMLPGNIVTLKDTTIRYNGWKNVEGPNYKGAQGSLSVVDAQGVATDELTPEKRNYDNAKGMTMTEASIRHHWNEDIYVSMGTPTDEGRGWVIRAYVKPFVLWIWIGTLFMALGGGVALFARRARPNENGGKAQ